MKDCELCKSEARTYCESDQASLCWECDKKVHGANFLVARHSRTLLCRVCHSFTPWKASGEKLGHTVSVCESCVNGQQEESRETNGVDNDDTDDEEEDMEEDEEDEGENQVVPWSTLTATLPAYDSPSSEDVSNSVEVFRVKGGRQDSLDLLSQAASVDSVSSSKNRETVPYRSKPAAIIVEPRKRFRNQRGEVGFSDINS